MVRVTARIDQITQDVNISANGTVGDLRDAIVSAIDSIDAGIKSSLDLVYMGSKMEPDSKKLNQVPNFGNTASGTPPVVYVTPGQIQLHIKLSLKYGQNEFMDIERKDVSITENETIANALRRAMQIPVTVSKRNERTPDDVYVLNVDTQEQQLPVRRDVMEKIALPCDDFARGNNATKRAHVQEIADRLLRPICGEFTGDLLASALSQ